MTLRIGQGWDVHRLVPGRKLMLGGLEIPSELGEEAFSDGDVLIHALIDALLGALSLGDIGSHFPPGNSRWKDASSSDLLQITLELVEKEGFSIVNVDSTVILETPKLKEWKEKIRQNLSVLLKISSKQLSIKAKTAEKLGPMGEGKGIEAQAVVLLQSKG